MGLIPYGRDKNCPDAAEIRALWARQAARYESVRIARSGRAVICPSCGELRQDMVTPAKCVRCFGPEIAT